MTEIRFLLDLVLNHKLPPGAKKLCLERIVEVEENLTIKMISPIQRTIEQAPSTQRLMEAQIQTSAPLMPPPSQRIVGGEVNTGNGTKGPRKF